jgi:hypothetical protein
MNISANDTPGAAGANASETPVQPRRRRMAREPKSSAAQTGKSESSRANEKRATKARGQSKIAAVIALLEREQGATLAEMVEATGWLPHTTRAALTGLKKKGHTVTKDKRDDRTCYRIVKAAE